MRELTAFQEEQRQALEIIKLLEAQVKSYHAYRRMGESTSVPTELAQELMASVDYTLGQVVSGSVEARLRMGQAILAGKAQKARVLLDLVRATAPQWQTECRWEALACLEKYLRGYDHLHLAHRIPEELFYPVLTPVPEGLRGIDHCLFFLNLLWLENQLMAGVEENALEALWDRLPQDTLNQCEQLLINGIGKVMLGSGLDTVVFRPREREALLQMAAERSLEQLCLSLERAAEGLCRLLDVREACAVDYAKSIVPQLHTRLTAGARGGSLGAVFL